MAVRRPRNLALKAWSEAAAMINAAQRPVLYLGGGVINAPDRVRELAEKANLPTTMTLMALGMLPKAHPLSLGMLGMHGARSTNFILQQSDLLVVLGARFDDRATGKVAEFCPDAKIIHVDIDRAELGKIKQAHVAIQADVDDVLAQLLPQIEAQSRDAWRGKVAELQQEFPGAIPEAGDPLSHYGLINAAAACVDDNAIITTDVGQHQMWTAQAYPLNRPRQWLTSGGLGTMGFGLPAAIGAALANPDKKVLCFSGDGSLMDEHSGDGDGGGKPVGCENHPDEQRSAGPGASAAEPVLPAGRVCCHLSGHD
ncbi:Acetolactate synthase isozyme 1 large subunit [Kluyvera cryocrescens]|uniref:Acetolactate synthase isozyme 1 large subunit n=1 Tax=Kluyvera cryocrescens TaxID=580 RepID=A0A485B2S9_KLUCR|nr:Acetolactate synthase isozyme 1 large subunit [Kluyvera cryocrescens]